MITTTAFALINIGFIPEADNQCLYVISYNDHCLYVGQCTGRRGYNLICRLGRHFGANINNCMRQNERSGASRQFNTMLSRLPKHVQEKFTLTLLDPHDLSNLVDLDNQQIRLKMMSADVSKRDISNNKMSKTVIDFCEKALAWSLCPVYCKAGYCDCSVGLPDELVRYLT